MNASFAAVAAAVDAAVAAGEARDAREGLVRVRVRRARQRRSDGTEETWLGVADRVRGGGEGAPPALPPLASPVPQSTRSESDASSWTSPLVRFRRRDFLASPRSQSELPLLTRPHLAQLFRHYTFQGVEAVVSEDVAQAEGAPALSAPADGPEADGGSLLLLSLRTKTWDELLEIRSGSGESLRAQGRQGTRATDAAGRDGSLGGRGRRMMMTRSALLRMACDCPGLLGPFLATEEVLLAFAKHAVPFDPLAHPHGTAASPDSGEKGGGDGGDVGEGRVGAGQVTRCALDFEGFLSVMFDLATRYCLRDGDGDSAERPYSSEAAESAFCFFVNTFLAPLYALRFPRVDSADASL
jgi:hypothetical protein